MKSTLPIIILVLISFRLFAQLPGLPEGRITVQVVGEEGNPVSNAKVTLGFTESHPKWGSSNPQPVTGLTNPEGTFSGTGPCPMTIGGKAESTGYYLSYLPHYEFKDVLAGRCQPWNPTVVVVLKKMGQPIPMYAKNVHTAIPVLDQLVGFDLTVGDWIKPFGKGTRSDFIFTLSRNITSRTDYSVSLKLAFAGKDGGLQIIPFVPDRGTSVLKLPRVAPTNNYTPTWGGILAHGSFGNIPLFPEGRGYFFRVQSGDEQSSDKSVQYGKIDGPISIVGAAADKPGVAFTYYLNGSGTTNLEFDPTMNLLTDLKEDEQVSAP